jgi:hypothetical protein
MKKTLIALAALLAYGIASEDDYQYQLMRERQNEHIRATGTKAPVSNQSSVYASGDHSGYGASR